MAGAPVSLCLDMLPKSVPFRHIAQLDLTVDAQHRGRTANAGDILQAEV